MTREEYEIKENWKLSSKGYEESDRYFLSYELQKNRLLISSIIVGTKFVHGNIFHQYELEKFSNSKIIFIDTNNFEEIKSTKIFNEEANYIILENYVIIQADNETWLYDIISLEPIKNIVCPEECGILYKFDSKYVFSYCKDIKENSLTLYKIENNKFIKQFEMESIIFNKLIPFNFEEIIRYHTFLFVLKDKRIIIMTSNNKMFLLEFPLDNLN